jgi:catechol 2,3-dioxygenase-like lactoylglutathione lyase family enzyme
VAQSSYLAHWVVKTARARAMITWYGQVFGATVVHEDDTIAFLTWDEESHRLALVKVPAPVKALFPLSRLRRKAYGIDHLAFTFDSLTTLLHKWDELRSLGIEPVWAINHGPTTSLYYEDPDGIRLEFQVENFPTPEQTADFFRSAEFAANPIGVTLDPGYLLERLQAGAPEAELLLQGAGTRPGTTQRSGRRAVTLRTL